MAMWISLFLVATTFSSVFCDRNGVPVLIWGNKVENIPPAYAGHTTSKKEFNENYVKEMMKPTQNIVTFLQDKLSVEDFTQMADVYQENSKGGMMQNLKSLVEDHPSVHLPSVSEASNTLGDLKKSFNGKVHQLASPFNLQSLKLSDNFPNMIVVKLPPTAGSAAEQLEAFHKIDEIIGSVTNFLKQQSAPFLAFYTAEKPSMVVMEEDNYLGRHLLAAADESNATIANTTCLLMYMEQLSLVIKPTDQGENKNDKAVLSLPKTDVQVQCSGNEGKVTLKYDKNTPDIKSNVTQITLTMLLKPSNGFWQVTGASLSYDVNVHLQDKMQNIKDNMNMIFNIFAPLKYSFHCTSLPPIYRAPPNGTTPETFFTSLEFKELQMQYSTSNDTLSRFGFANECEGFFSAPIWMGLVCTLVLGSILALGLCFLANIHSMDRFDDPKGKTITVNVSE